MMSTEPSLQGHSTFVRLGTSLRLRPHTSGIRRSLTRHVTVFGKFHKGVVITGGTKGLGYAMASEFLTSGDSVVICGRDEARTDAAVEALSNAHPDAQIWGRRCDVAVAVEVAQLADYARERLGTVHFWLNNAGQVTQKRLLPDIPAAEVADVVGVNVLGSLLGCREALRLMREQSSSSAPIYHIFNMGFSSWGANLSKTACTHKSTKTALTQLTQTLSQELKDAGLSSIGVHNLSPGLVLTDLLLKDSTPGARRFFNTLAEEPQTVAAALVPRIRAVQGSGQSIDFLTPATAFTRVITGLPQILQGGRFFDKEGRRVEHEGERYHPNGVRVPF